MIKSTKTWMCGLTLTLGLAACDDPGAAEVELDGDDVTFRGGDGTWGPGKLNTHFLGVNETYRLDNIPLVDDPQAPVRLHAVWARRCVDRVNGVTYKNGPLFYTSDLVGDLGISVVDGELQPATFKQYGKDHVTCEVAANDWVGTIWGVITEDALGTETNHYMMILDQRLDEHGNRVYKWGVLTGPDPFNLKYYVPTCAEDQDPFGVDTVLLRYHAYLVDGLAVDLASGGFSAAAASVFIACRSGAVGKAIDWGYAPWDHDMAIHELATRVVRADYCGDGEHHTEVGNEVHVRDEFGVNDFSQLAMIKEAAWDLETSRATCLSLPRDAFYQNGPPIACGGVPLPECTDEMIDDATIATKLSE